MKRENSIKDVVRKSMHALLNNGSYDELNDEQKALVVEYETEIYKEKVDKLRKTILPEEIEERIHE